MIFKDWFEKHFIADQIGPLVKIKMESAYESGYKQAIEDIKEKLVTIPSHLIILDQDQTFACVLTIELVEALRDLELK